MKNEEKEESPVMPKPKFKVGEQVTVNFLGALKECIILEQTKNRYHIDRWIYKVKETKTGTVIPYVGINGSEKFANIWTIPKESLEIPKENLENSKD